MHISGLKIGWLHVGHKEREKFRYIDLLNEADAPSMTIFAMVVVTPKARMSSPRNVTRS